MDCIWEVRVPKKLPLWKRIRQTIGPFVLVSALGLIVVLWTAVAGSWTSLIKFFSINGTLTSIVVALVQIVLSFLVATLLLLIVYKMIPEAKVHWQDVTLASITTGIAFTVTNYIFGTYIQTFTVTTVTGAAGALLIILIWIFVLNQIVLFGAEVSKVYATTVEPHAIQHLPASSEKIILPIEKIGEIIEEATKDELETRQETAKNLIDKNPEDNVRKKCKFV
jgi:membrane protein